MDPSTQVTIRSAIIIGCMILVPLWALVGNSWTNVFRSTANASPVHTAGHSKAPPAYEPRRGAPPPESHLVRDDQRRDPTPDLVAPPIDMQPLAAIPTAEQVFSEPYAPPAVPLGRSELSSPLNSSVATRITSTVATSTAGDHAIQPVSSTEFAPSAVQQLPPVTPPPTVVSQPPPAPASPGDWFQWTESRLKHLGASQFILESSGAQGGYRFRCKVALANDPGFARHFDAQGDSALAAMQDVLRQVEVWHANVK